MLEVNRGDEADNVTQVQIVGSYMHVVYKSCGPHKLSLKINVHNKDLRVARINLVNWL